jgi:hypothetical protein
MRMKHGGWKKSTWEDVASKRKTGCCFLKKDGRLEKAPNPYRPLNVSAGRDKTVFFMR